MPRCSPQAWPPFEVQRCTIRWLRGARGARHAKMPGARLSARRATSPATNSIEAPHQLPPSTLMRLWRGLGRASFEASTSASTRAPRRPTDGPAIESRRSSSRERAPSPATSSAAKRGRGSLQRYRPRLAIDGRSAILEERVGYAFGARERSARSSARRARSSGCERRFPHRKCGRHKCETTNCLRIGGSVTRWRPFAPAAPNVRTDASACRPTREW